MKTQTTIIQESKTELVKFIKNMNHVERNLAIFNSLPIAGVLNLELPSLENINIMLISLDDGCHDPELIFEFLKVARFGAICFQLGFTFNGDGFGIPLTTICYICNPKATLELLNSHDGFNYMDDVMPFQVEDILMYDIEISSISKVAQILENALKTITELVI